jgi:hypothetical protein
MQLKQKRHAETALVPPTPIAAGGADAEPEPSGAAQRSVFCQCSIHDGHFPVAGMTVGEARRVLAPLLHIEPEAVAVINGQIVEGDVVIGDDVAMLNFVKPSSVKGGGDSHE